MTIRILLVDDHTLFRSGLKALLSRQSDFEVVGEAADGFEGVKLAEQLKPDVVLLDIRMPNMNGVGATQRIKTEFPNAKVLILTTFDDSDYILNAINYGASGYLLKDIGGDDRGALALGRYVGDIKVSGYEMYAVINASRPLTRTPEETAEVLREIEAASALPFTGIVNNTNLAAETTPEIIYASREYMEKLSALSGLPIWMTTAEKRVAEKLELENVLPLTLQEKYFDLPSQKPGNRPLWG